MVFTAEMNQQVNFLKLDNDFLLEQLYSQNLCCINSLLSLYTFLLLSCFFFLFSLFFNISFFEIICNVKSAI